MSFLPSAAWATEKLAERGGSAFKCRVTPFARLAVLAALLAAFSTCCNEVRKNRRSKDPAVAVAASAQPAALAQRVAYRRFQVTERLGAELPRPERFHEQPCPDSSLDARAPSLVLASQDVRYEPKHLLPLDLLEELLGPDRRFAAHALRFGETATSALSEEEATSALGELDVLAQRRYKAVYYVTDYASPKLVRKQNRVRSEWLPGVIATWLVVHDLKDGRALCQAQVIVRNDVTGEPITRKMKASVRQRLIVELASALRSDGKLALARISGTLKFPRAHSVE
ncbi:MAG TPA: hypothetical protein VK524_13600 [Polyangiaceae bacterium]|nr:hypothetical protein [Polyangiaceae bacterium]